MFSPSNSKTFLLYLYVKYDNMKRRVCRFLKTEQNIILLLKYTCVGFISIKLLRENQMKKL